MFRGKKSKRVDILGMEVGWGGSRGSDMCRGLRQEGAFATVCAKENSEEGADSRVARRLTRKGGRRKNLGNNNEGVVVECRVYPMYRRIG